MKTGPSRRNVAVYCSLGVSLYAAAFGLSLLVTRFSAYDPLLTLSIRTLLFLALASPFVLLVAVAGILGALSLGRENRRKWLFAAVNALGLAGSETLIYMLLSFGGLYPSSEDSADAGQIFDYLQARHWFHRTSVVEPGRIPVWTPPGVKGSPHTVMIYYVTDRTEQDEIITLLKDYRSAGHPRPLVVEFYEKENWITDARGEDGRETSGHRGREKCIRKVKLK